jgi:Tfp pilus assembly protein PilP
MKLMSAILAVGIAAGAAWAQNPDIIENTRNTMKAVQQKKAIDSNAALAASQSPAPASPVNQPAASSARPAMPKPAMQPATHAVKQGASAAAKPQAPKATKKVTRVAAKKAPKEHVAVADKKSPADNKKPAPKAISLTGRRDPFISPVVNRSMVGSGCSTGKRCLAIDQIALKGVVKSDNGMIAVVVNALDKAYFLHENDPVFNGYVVKITGDSIIFKETVQDKLGKSFTREVTKKITTPAV